jgi:hypothetical protein
MKDKKFNSNYIELELCKIIKKTYLGSFAVTGFGILALFVCAFVGEETIGAFAFTIAMIGLGGVLSILYVCSMLESKGIVLNESTTEPLILTQQIKPYETNP